MLYLDDEKDDGILGVIFAGVCASNDTILTCRSGSWGGRGGGLCGYGGSDGGDDQARHGVDASESEARLAMKDG